MNNMSTSNRLRMDGKKAVVTGGAAGIGKCIVKTLAEGGAKVFFIDNSKDDIDRTGKEFSAAGLDAVPYIGDIADESVLKEFAAFVLGSASNGIDLLVNNACISRGGLNTYCSYVDFNYVLRVGISAPYMLTQLFSEHFLNGASIVNIASSRAFMSQPDTESYSAAKGGIIALTHAMAASLAGRVRVNSISPGWIDTGMYHSTGRKADYSESDIKQHTSGRVGEPEDIASAVMFLADNRNSFINAENIVIDGGMTRLMIYHNDHGWTMH